MKTIITTEALTVWITGIKECAKMDDDTSIYWFGPTVNKPFSIIAGWQKMFKEDYSDLFCVSKSQPEYVMCIKVVENKGPYAYSDFEVLDMPLDKNGEVDDTCVPLEWDDNPACAAEFFLHEWERIMTAAEKEI